MNRSSRSTALLLLAVLSVGCSEQPSSDPTPPVRTAEDQASPAPTPTPDVASPESAQPSAESSGSAELKAFDGMKFAVPATFESMPLSEMQKGIIAAKFGIPSIGEDISFTLSISGGTLEDNIGRWKGQFSGGTPAVQETLSTNAGEATVVKLSGDFAPGMGRPPQTDWSMVGVIIPMGERNYYAKLTGPTDQVTRAEESFLTFCKSARPE